MEKDNVLYFVFLIKITNQEIKNLVIKRKNEMESCFGEPDYIFTDDEDYYFKFRVSINSSHERFNMGIIEKAYNLSIENLLSFYKS